MSEKADKGKAGQPVEMLECAHCKEKSAAGDMKKDSKIAICQKCYYKNYDMCDKCKKIVKKDEIFEDQIDMMDVNRRCKECHEALHVRCVKCNKWGDKEMMKEGVCEDCLAPPSTEQ